MLTMTPTRVPEDLDARLLGVRGLRSALTPLFFDDVLAVMYRKIDTTPLSATSPQHHAGSGEAAGIVPSRRGSLVESDCERVVFSLIPSRMTHRPLFAPAGALSRE